MDTPFYYQSEAARCRALASKSTDPDAVKRWLQLAADYEQIARDIGAAAAAQVQRVPMQQQPQQQQQQQQQREAGPEAPENKE